MEGGKEYLCNLKEARATNVEFVDFVSHAKSMGANGEKVSSISDLESAFMRAKKSDKTYIISIKTDGYQWLEGTAFWESPTLEVSSTEENQKAHEEHVEGKNRQRKGV